MEDGSAGNVESDSDAPSASSNEQNDGTDHGDETGGGDSDQGSEDPSENPSIDALPSARLPRLTSAQYRNAINDLLGAGLEIPQLEPDTQPWFYSVVGAAESTLSAHGAEQYGVAADKLAQQVIADLDRREAVYGCTNPAGEPTCLRSFLVQFGLRAWRRPLTTIELERYERLGEATSVVGQPWRPFRYVLSAILQSPNFLYRAELGEPDPADAGRLRYTSYEMASRLAFMLGNSIPDHVLLAAALADELGTAAAVEEHTTRLLDANDAQPRGILRFFREFLALERANTVEFPGELATPTLGESMVREAVAYVTRALAPGADYRDVFTSTSTEINSDLAQLYGIDEATDDSFVPWTFPDDGPRAGLLTSAAVLTMSSLFERTSPTIRGVFIRQRFTCTEIPAPPDDVPPLDDGQDTEGMTPKELLEYHMQDPVCAACHSVFDPVGLGMEDFDQFARHREHYANGFPVEDESSLGGVDFEGARELGVVLSQRHEVMRCLTRNLYRYALARLEMDIDENRIDKLTAEFEKGYELRSLIVALVTNDAFRFARSGK